MKRTGAETNPYIIAFFNKHDINIGDEFKTYEYMFWIDKKHDEYREKEGLPNFITLNPIQVKDFIEFINS